MPPSLPTRLLAVMALAALTAPACEGSDHERSPGASLKARAPAARPRAADAGPAEPWDERPAVPAPWNPPDSPLVATALEPPRRGRRFREPPAPSVPPRKLWPGLLHLERLYTTGRPAAARTAAAALARDPALGTRYLAATVWGCPPCALDAVKRLRKRLQKAGFAWTEARWLLPLCGHPDDAVRAASLAAFGWAATRLATAALRRRLSYHLPVFRLLATDPSAWVRAEAVALLGILRDRTSYRLLGRRLRDPRPVVRVAAVRAIATAITLVPKAPTTRAVCAHLGDPSPAVRAAVLTALRLAPRACPLPRVAGLLGDRFLVRLRGLTWSHGDGGLREHGAEVRQAAWLALPAALRPSAPGLPLALRVKDAIQALGRAGVKVSVPGPFRLRPRRPVRPAAVRPAADPVLARWLAAPGPLGRIRNRLKSPGARADLGRMLGRLPERARHRALEACRGRPLRGPLLAGVLGLLAHPAAETRWVALDVLARGTVDDQKRRVLERALWLARRDPHPLVRRRALGLLVSWHAGAAVRQRVRRALSDPHPAVRLAALAALARLRGGTLPARVRLRALHEVAPVRAALLYRWIRDRRRPPPVAAVIRALGDDSPTRIRVRLGARWQQVDPGYPTVRSAALMALEAAFGARHRGQEVERARRWQDELRLRGWDLDAPARPGTLPVR